MDTKWKNNGQLVGWLLLCGYGISGVLNCWFDVYVYFEQPPFFWVYTAGAVIALLLSIIFMNKQNFFTRIAPERWQAAYNKIPLDVAAFLFVMTGFIAVGFSLINSPWFYNHYIDMIKGLVYSLISNTFWIGLTLFQGIYFFRRLSDTTNLKEDGKRALIIRFITMLRDAFLNRRIGFQVFFLLCIFFSLGLFFGLVFAHEAFFILLIPMMILIVPVWILIVRRTGDFNKILHNAHAQANGRSTPDLEVKGKSPMAALARDMNQMKQGVKISRVAQAKSERLKTELITNVSHDLRTPLTSILTYSELLKNGEATEEERSNYIDIIDRKSKRLKVLIDDLFEASKMASGNIELVREKVDINQLLEQALAEYNDSIEESPIQFRVSKMDEPVYALVDGQKLWRVFDNLIENMLKYSLPQTRAYIQVKQEEDHLILSFKNISEYELSENIDELFERFKRGDESRHTDGSGLGLAISKSIIDLHGGSMDIGVDGDLFKVTIRLDLAKA